MNKKLILKSLPVIEERQEGTFVMLKTNNKTIIFASLLITCFQLPAMQEEKQESIITSDKMQKSLSIKVLGLMMAGVGLSMIKHSISEPAVACMLLIPLEQKLKKTSDRFYYQNSEVSRKIPNNKIKTFDHISKEQGFFLFRIEALVGCLLTYKGFDLIANSDQITSNAFVRNAAYKLSDIGKYLINKVTFGRICK